MEELLLSKAHYSTIDGLLLMHVSVILAYFLLNVTFSYMHLELLQSLERAEWKRLYIWSKRSILSMLDTSHDRK